MQGTSMRCITLSAPTLYRANPGQRTTKSTMRRSLWMQFWMVFSKNMAAHYGSEKFLSLKGCLNEVTPWTAMGTEELSHLRYGFRTSCTIATRKILPASRNRYKVSRRPLAIWDRPQKRSTAQPDRSCAEPWMQMTCEAGRKGESLICSGICQYYHLCRFM